MQTKYAGLRMALRASLARRIGRLLAAGVACIVMAPLARADDVAIERAMLPVTIAGKAVRLEALIAKPVVAADKLPIALIVPGQTITNPVSPAIDGHAALARDLARRGWLSAVIMRRGEGQSEGQKPPALTCQDAAFAQRLAADAEELAATLAALGTRTDADASRELVIGASGAGAAAVALSANAPAGLKAVVNIAGGLRADGNCPWQQNLVNAYRDLGRRSRIPNIWLYAENDTAFAPDLVERMHATFLDGGGDVTFMAFGNVGKDGQTLFTDPAGRRDWLREMEAFLRAHTLPTWTRADVNVVLKRLGYQADITHPEALTLLANYFAAAGEKALAHSTSSAFVGRRPTLQFSAGRPTLEAARAGAIELCEKTAAPCEIVMENFSWAGSTP